jgi:hypothetical protein
MRRKIHFSLLIAVTLAALALSPRPAQAQWHGGHGGAHVVVGFGWGYPYWGSGYPYWGLGWGWGYPYWGWGNPYWGAYPHAPDNSAELKLEVKPKDAQVYVDGYYVGIVDDFDGAFQRMELEAGPHRVEIRAAGFQTIAFDVRIEPNDTVTYRGQLQELSRR